MVRSWAPSPIRKNSLQQHHPVRWLIIEKGTAATATAANTATTSARAKENAPAELPAKVHPLAKRHKLADAVAEHEEGHDRPEQRVADAGRQDQAPHFKTSYDAKRHGLEAALQIQDPREAVARGQADAQSSTDDGRPRGPGLVGSIYRVVVLRGGLHAFNRVDGVQASAE